MSHPKEAWKFKAWTEAMLRGAIVGNPQYKTHGKRSGTTSLTKRRKRRRRKKRKDA